MPADRATIVDAVRSRGLNIRDQRADGCASLTNSPGPVRNPRFDDGQGNTHFEDFFRT
jgi:hypothetical protein